MVSTREVVACAAAESTRRQRDHCERKLPLDKARLSGYGLHAMTDGTTRMLLRDLIILALPGLPGASVRSSG